MIYISLVIIIGLALATILRIFYREGRKKKKHMDLMRTYDRLVLKNKLSIEEAHVNGNRLIGFDGLNKKLLLIDHSSVVKQEECVAIGQIDSCRIVLEKDEITNCTVNLFLELNYKRNKGQSKFVFFDESKDKIIEKPSLMKRAEYWKRKIDMHKNAGRVGSGFEFVL